jgi:predicted secreted protein
MTLSYVSPFTGDVIQPTDVSYASYTLTGNLQLDWPSASSPTEYPAARIMDITASSSGYSLIMPPANQVSVGQDALIRNLGANTVTVKNYAGGTICTVTAGQAQYIYVTSNSNTAGVWGVIAFGAGTSSADASILAGYGLMAISSTLNQSHPAATITSPYTFVAADRAQTKIWTSGAGTGTLGYASSYANNWFTLIKNNGTGTFTISTTGGELIDGQTSKQFNPDESAFIICTGSGFITVGYGVSQNFSFTVLAKPVTGGAYSLTSSEASNLIQEYVGTLTSNVTVTYPPVVNLYVVSNQTVDNGYTLTLTTGISGAAVATIPPGQQATLICDGTNFLNANTVQAGATVLSILNGTVGTPAINFAAETNTGIWRSGAGEFDISILGTNRFALTALGLAIIGTGNFTGGVSGGTFT